MPPSSEEPLHSGLSVNAGFGYYPANAHQILDGGKYTIVRKLGWGPRSSTWLVRRTKKGSMYYLAAQIFTVAASKAVAERLHPIIRNRLLIKTDIVSLPTVHSRFWETSVHGKHFCMTLNPYGPPIKSLLRKAVKDGQAGLPVHTVQYTTSRVVQALSVFHHKKIMHGDVTPERVVFDILMGSSCVEPLLDAEPTSEAVFVDGFPVLPSQPLDLNKHKWNEPMSHVAEWMLSLVWYGHAQASPYKVEAGHDYCSAPETLLANPTCGPETDIWMLGCLVFELLTGSKLLSVTGSSAEKLAEIQNVLQVKIPDAWLSHESLRALPLVNAEVRTLQDRLNEALQDEDATEAYEFLKSV